MRQTSIEAYNFIKFNNILSERRWQVYDVVFHHGPMTSAEAFVILNRLYPIKNLTQSRARFTELRDMGAFYEVKVRQCSVSGMQAIEWDVTNRIPGKLIKQKRIKCVPCDGRGFFLETKETSSAP